MTKIRSNGIKGDILLLLAAFIYGSGLVAQKAGMNNLGPLTFTAIRFILGGLALLPVVYILEKHKSDEQRKSELTLRQMLPGCFISGINLVIGVLAQQYGLPLTTVGKAGFITGLYVILTPIAGVVILRRKIGVRIWLAAIIAVAGFYFLSLSEGFGMLNKGDGFMLIAAVSCTFFVYTMEHFAKQADAVKFTAFQFLATGLICIPGSLIFETTTWNDIQLGLIPILYAGLGICAIGYTFQMIGQKYVESSRATVLLSSETLFSLFSGMLYYNEHFTKKEYIGCALMFTAIILAESQKRSGNKGEITVFEEDVNI